VRCSAGRSPSSLSDKATVDAESFSEMSRAVACRTITACVGVAEHDAHSATTMTARKDRRMGLVRGSLSGCHPERSEGSVASLRMTVRLKKEMFTNLSNDFIDRQRAIDRLGTAWRLQCRKLTIEHRR
jgi:hypothetical protein